MIHRIAIVQWLPGDEIAHAMCKELVGLGYEPVLFWYHEPIPAGVDMVLTFAPYNKLLPIASQMERFGSHDRPVFVHWQTQNLPDPNIPWTIMKKIASFRSWIDRLDDSGKSVDRFLSRTKPIRSLRQKLYRFRYIGDYQFAYHQGWIDILVHSSPIFTRHDVARGMPAVYIPWGTPLAWYRDLHLERDIDVLWFGKRRTKRRSQLLDAVRDELRKRGVEMYVVDGEERPFIYGDKRIGVLNRSKTVLNLRINPYDNVRTYRFQMVAGNKSLLISEPELDHQPRCIVGKHFVEAKADEITDRIIYYLSHHDERRQIAENAYRLVTEELTMANSLSTLLSVVEDSLAGKNQ